MTKIFVDANYLENVEQQLEDLSDKHCEAMDAVEAFRGLLEELEADSPHQHVRDEINTLLAQYRTVTF